MLSARMATMLGEIGIVVVMTIVSVTALMSQMVVIVMPFVMVASFTVMVIMMARMMAATFLMTAVLLGVVSMEGTILVMVS